MKKVKEKDLAAAIVKRRRAEERCRARKTDPRLVMTDAESQRLIHELEVHQIELEMQNDELAQARDEVEKALENYTDLYDFAPLGYVTLDRVGTVQAANLTAGNLLALERSRLLGCRFGNFVIDKYRAAFTAFLGKVFSSQVKETGEIGLLDKEDRLHIVQIEAILKASGEECSLALIDIT